MTYIGDFRIGATFDLKFCTVTTTGAPTQLAGSPVVSIYPDNSTTQITAGITLSVDFDGITGLNHVRVVATVANGYASATNYQVVVTTGTVGGTSVVGYVVGQFSIENRVASGLIRSNTAQAGAASTITLDSGASAVNDFYAYTLIQLVGGTGVGQSRIIGAYVGSTKVATLTQAWATAPDSTSQFVIWPSGVVTATAPPTANENADAFLARDIGSGTGAGSVNERTVRAALRWNRNKITVIGTTMTVYKEDDTTIAWTGTVSGGLATALGMDAT